MGTQSKKESHVSAPEFIPELIRTANWYWGNGCNNIQAYPTAKKLTLTISTYKVFSVTHPYLQTPYTDDIII